MTRLKVHFDPKSRRRLFAVAAMLTATVTLAAACSSTNEGAAGDASTTTSAEVSVGTIDTISDAFADDDSGDTIDAILVV